MNEGIKPAKICYDHIGGKLGTLFLEHFITRGWIAEVICKERHFSIPLSGTHCFEQQGIDLSQIQSEIPENVIGKCADCATQAC